MRRIEVTKVPKVNEGDSGKKDEPAKDILKKAWHFEYLCLFLQIILF